jgi:TonB family protein
MIGYAMLYTVVVSVPLVAAAMFVAHFLQTHGRAERGVWVVASVATLVVPAIMLSRPVQAPAEAWLPPLQVELVTIPALPGPAQVAAVESSGAPSSGSVPVDLDALLLGAWLLASLALAARWIVSAVRLNRLSQSWLSDTVEGVPVWLAPELGPAVTGVLRPRVVVPAWVPALSDEQRALVLLHEQEHVRARDPWLVTMARLTRIVTPWNPATWLLSSRLKRAVELDCDRRVLRRHPSVEAYGETLLAVSARGSNRLLSAAAFAESDVPLRKRILAMTTPPRAVSVVGVFVTVAVGSTLVSSAIAVPVPAMRVLPAPAVVLPGLMAEVREEARAINPGEAEAQLPEPFDADDLVASVVPEPQSSSVAISQQVQTLPDPRVIADPRHPWLIVYRLSDLRAGRNGPEWQLARFPMNDRPDSLMTIVREIYGDSVVVLSTTMSLQRNLAPQTSIPPRVRNPDEVLRAIAEEYPVELLARGRGGTVGVLFLVGSRGQVEEVRIGQVSAYTALDEAAMRVADIYRFTPAMRGPDPVPVWVSHAISFYPPQ